MKDLLKKLLTRIPDEYRDEFVRDINRHNLFKAIIAALVIIVAETITILFFSAYTYKTLTVDYFIIIFSIVLFPVLCILHSKNRADRLAYATYMLYLCVLLIFFLILAIVPQDRFASINTYVIGLFGFAAFVYVPPAESFIVYLTLYLGFFFALPVYQPDEQFVTALRFNAFFMNVFAFILSRLVYRMKVNLFIDHKVIEQKNQILKEMISRDPMTSLLNHECAYRTLQEEINRAKRIGYPLSIIMADIDGFKPVNDKFGHQIGDQVIISVAGIIVGTCRRTDVVCRYGGDEYMLILPDTSLEEAALLAGRILSRVESAELVNGIRATLSAGVSECVGESVKELIFRADRQLYRAKDRGKNRVSFSG